MMNSHKSEKLNKRILRVKNKVRGTAAKPRLSVTRSNSNIYAQIIDDEAGHTLVACSTLSAKSKEEVAKAEAAVSAGKLVAQQALEKGITQVVFDRRGRQYHGRIASFAQAAREAGLKF